MSPDLIAELIAQDQLHRKEALDPAKSFIIQAPAGSGKTEILIQRFLTLLAFVKSPDEILAITFTKKAANEMRDRIINALKDAMTNSPPDAMHKKITWDLARKVLQQDSQLNWNLIQNPNQLRIQTIDALCTYLTKQLPLLSTFGSPPTIAIDPRILYRESIKEAFLQLEENNEWSNAISQLLLHLDNDLNKLLHLLVQMLEKRDQWQSYIQLNLNQTSLRKELEHHLSLVISDHLKKLRDCIPKEIIPELLAIARFAANHLALSKASSPIVACLDLTALPSTQAKDKEKWIGLASMVLTKNFSWRKRLDGDIGFPRVPSRTTPENETLRVYKQKLLALIESISGREDLRKLLQSLFFLPESNYLDQQWEILKSLLSVLKIVLAELRLTFQQHGQIDFVENGQAALTALGDDERPTDLALSLDYQLRHILIDEFQDTSETQYQLLKKLTIGWMNNDGRTLFVVGDPMQSIYRFREARVGLFIHMIKHGIGEIKLTPLSLAVNFRSSPTIINWNNAHFQKIFPAVDDIQSGAVSYSKSISNQHLKNNYHQGSYPSTVKVEGLINANDEMQATCIVDLIKSIKENHALAHEKIAILVRSRTHLSAIISALKNAKISYRAIEIDSLTKRQSIQDLVSLTSALIHPADRIAWLSILRAPWCGLQLIDLLHITASKTPGSILSQLENQTLFETLSDDAKCRLSRVLPILKTKVLERGRYDLRCLIENTWLELGGPACIADYSELHDINEFFNLLTEFDLKNEMISFENLKEKVDQLYASTHDDDTLQIMTIHAAKGLEFDTVIIPHLERKGRTDEKSLLLWMEQQLSHDISALLLAPLPTFSKDKNSIYEYINRETKIKSDYETDRLFYVATTRAIRNLYLFFNLEQKDEDHFKIESGSFLEKLWPQIEKQKDNIIKKPSTFVESLDVKTQRYLSRLTSSWKNPIEDISRPLTSHQNKTGFLLPDNQSKVIGTISHSILQKLSLNGIKWWQNQSSKNQLTYIKSQLYRTYISSESLETTADAIYKIIRNTLRCPKGLWILHPHEEAKSEFPITVLINGRPESLMIDRTFIDEKGVRWIIDYKTATQSYADLDIFLKKEEEKYMAQMNKYYQAMKLLSDHPIRVGLYFPTLPAFREWEF